MVHHEAIDGALVSSNGHKPLPIRSLVGQDRERQSCAKKGVVCRSQPSLSGSNEAMVFRGTKRVSTSPDFSLTDVRTLSWKKPGWVVSYNSAVFLRFADDAAFCVRITNGIGKNRMG